MQMPNLECEQYCPMVATCYERQALLKDYSIQLGLRAMKVSEAGPAPKPKKIDPRLEEASQRIEQIDEQIKELGLYKHALIGVEPAICEGPKKRKRFGFFGKVIYKCMSERYDPPYHYVLRTANKQLRELGATVLEMLP